MPREEATGFGVMQVDDNDRIVDFVEKPTDPPAMPGKPDLALASMGIYVFHTDFLFEQLRRDAADPEFHPRFRQGHHSLARGEGAKRWRIASPAPACVPRRKRDAYWRDVGTVDAYWEANIDLTDVVPRPRPL